MSRHHLNTQQTGDIQLSLFGDHTPVTRPAPAQPERELPGGATGWKDSGKPQYDPNQLQLMVNPTEVLARMHRSTDMSVLPQANVALRQGDITQEDIDKIDAPSDDMKKMMAYKEFESKQESGYHGAGVYGIFERGEQVRTPIQHHIMTNTDSEADYTQYQGHHRVAAGAAWERDVGGPGSVWMPIQYNDYRPPPPKPAHTRGGRRQNDLMLLGDSDMRAGAAAVHGAATASDVRTTDQYRFQNDAFDAIGNIKARRRFHDEPRHGAATNRQNAIAAAVMMGQNQRTWPKRGMGADTAVENVLGGHKPGETQDFPMPTENPAMRTLGTTTNRAIDDLMNVLGKPRNHQRQQTNGVINDQARHELVGWAQQQQAAAQEMHDRKRAMFGTSIANQDYAVQQQRAGGRLPNIKQADSSLERLLNEEEGIARRMHANHPTMAGLLQPAQQRQGPGPETRSRINELLNPEGARALAGSLLPQSQRPQLPPAGTYTKAEAERAAQYRNRRKNGGVFSPPKGKRLTTM